jgi:hypothetical protein
MDHIVEKERERFEQEQRALENAKEDREAIS